MRGTKAYSKGVVDRVGGGWLSVTTQGQGHWQVEGSAQSKI